MSTKTLNGVVLRRWDVGESDRRLSLLTESHGKIYAIARGARKAKSSLASSSEPLVAGTFEVAIGKRSNYVTQVQPKAAFPAIRGEYARLSCALAWLEVLEAVVAPGEPSEGLFNLCLLGLAGIEAAKTPHGALVWADLHLMEMTGYHPQFTVSVASGKPLVGPLQLSPPEGGCVLDTEARGEAGSYPVSREAVVTLSKLQILGEPPNFVRHAAEVLAALTPFWTYVLSHDLPARRTVLES